MWAWLVMLGLQLAAVPVWPHEPPAFRIVMDAAFLTAAPQGWTLEYNEQGLAAPVDAIDAPWSPPGVMQFTYPRGRAGGEAPATLWAGLPHAEAVYVGMWWRANADWDGHPSNVNKLQYLFTNSQGSVFLALYGPPGGPYELRVFPQFVTSGDTWLRPNVTATPVDLAAWHRIEWLVEYTAPGVGRVRWWLDDVLQGDHAGLPFPGQRLIEYKLSPVWGGVGGTKRSTDYFWYDHIRLSIGGPP